MHPSKRDFTFNLVHTPSANTKGGGVITYITANQQGAITFEQLSQHLSVKNEPSQSGFSALKQVKIVLAEVLTLLLCWLLNFLHSRQLKHVPTHIPGCLANQHLTVDKSTLRAFQFDQL